MGVAIGGSDRLKRRLPPVLLVLVGIGAIGPLLFVLWTSLTVDGRFSLAPFINAVKDSAVRQALLNTVLYLVFTVPPSVALGLGLALIASRLQSSVMRILPFISLLMPPLVGAMGWVLLFAPRAGLVNVGLRAITDSSAASGPINIYSIGGVYVTSIVFSVPFAYLYCLSALDNLDPSVEEAARMAGATRWQVLRTVSIPLIRPGLSSAILLTTLLSLAEFSIPLIIGRPFGFWVLTMEIYQAARGAYPPDNATAAAIGSMLLLVAVVGIYLQRRSLSKGSYVTIAGKAARKRQPFTGRAKVASLSVVWLYIVLTVIGPLAALAVVSLQPFWSARIVPSQFTLKHYGEIFSLQGDAFGAFGHSFVLAVVAATVAVLVTALSAYVIVRSKGPSRVVLDYVLMLPSGLPHTVLGLGFLLFFLLGPIKIYGTLFALALCYVILFLPLASRAALTSMHQISAELEEASLVSGASWLKTIGRITLPLISPGLWSAWILVFVLAFRELSASIFLSVSGTEVVSTYLADRWEFGLIPEVAGIGLLVVLAATIIVLVLDRFQRRRNYAK